MTRRHNPISPNFIHPWILLLVALLLAAGLGRAAMGQDDDGALPQTQPGKGQKKPPPVNMVVQVGQGKWVGADAPQPIRVTLDNFADPIRGVIEFSDGRSGVTATPYELPRGAHKVYTFFAPFRPDMGARGNGISSIRLLDGRRTVVQQEVAPRFLEQQRLVVTCSGDGAGLRFLNEGREQSFAEERAQTIASHVAPLDMPSVWPAFRPARVVVISGNAWADLSPEQRRATRIWIETGGRAILCAESTAHFRDAEAAALRAISPSRVIPAPVLASTRQWSEIPYQGPGQGILTVDGPQEPHTTPILNEAGRPLILMRHAGMGIVLWTSFDPFREGCRYWPGNEKFWRWAIDQTSKAPPLLAPLALESSPSIQSAAAVLPRLPAPSMPLVIGFGVLYALVFGPLNLLMIRRMRRTVRSWLWMPSLAVVTTTILMIAGLQWGSSRAILNRVEVLQTSVGALTAEETSVVGLFSPTNRTFSVSLDDPAPRIQERASSGGSGSSLAASFDWPHLQTDGLLEWENVSFQLYSTRFIETQRPYDLAGTLQAKPAGREKLQLVNGTRLRLEHAYVSDGTVHWPIGSLNPGQSAVLRLTRPVAGPAPTLPPGVAGGRAASPLVTEQELAGFNQHLQTVWREAVGSLVPAGRSRSRWLVAFVVSDRPQMEFKGIHTTQEGCLLLARLP